METKELKIEIPKGYEIDKECSTFEHIIFKPIKNITYEDICNVLKPNYFIGSYGNVYTNNFLGANKITDKNHSTNKRQLKKLLALNQLLNIAEYYNKQHPEQSDYPYYITFEEEYGYKEGGYDLSYPLYRLVALFNKAEDVQDVIKNPNF